MLARVPTTRRSPTSNSSPTNMMKRHYYGLPSCWKRHNRVELMLLILLCMVVTASFWLAIHIHEEDSALPLSSLFLTTATTTTTTSLNGQQPQQQQQGLPMKAVRNPNERMLWHNSSNIPVWMQEYMDWHYHIITNELTPKTIQKYQYLILRCYRLDERCGGVSDRLKPIPLVLLAAYKSNRLLFIHWDRPHRLEEFLVPPRNGFNWTIPDFLIPLAYENSHGSIGRAGLLMKATQQSGIIKACHIHDSQGGSAQYDEIQGKDAFLNVFHDLFHVMFRPSSKLESYMKEILSKHTIPIQHSKQQRSPTTSLFDLLQPGKYSVAHYRAEYGKEITRHPKLTQPDFIQDVALNSIRCAIELQPNDPIYFASDNYVALQAIQKYAQYVQYPIITFHREEEIVLRLDDIGENKNNNTTTKPIQYEPKDYYSTFIDLLLTGSGNCVTFGRGGFGRFANLLSYNATCAKKHVKAFFPEKCHGYPPIDKTIQELQLEGFTF